MSRQARAPGPRRRLRRLQLRLTLAYTLVTLAGVSVLSWLVIRTDGRSWRTAEFDEMARHAAVSTSLIYYTDAGIQLDGLRDDESTRGRHLVNILLRRPKDGGPSPGTDGRLTGATEPGHGRGGLERVFASGKRALDVTDDQIAALARSAMDEDVTVRKEIPAGGRVACAVARPFYHDETHRTTGAVVVIGDPGLRLAEHQRLTYAVLAGSGLLTALAAVTGHLLSGRSLRPAWQALEAQERLLADAAHELRTPVAVMRSTVDIAGTDPRSLPTHLPRIRRATDRLTDVVENVLARGRLQNSAATFMPVPLRLDQIVEDASADLTRDRCTLTLRLDEAVVNADPALVRIAVSNLLDNALRHGRTPGDPGGGAEIDVSVRGHRVAVADRGPGLAGEELEQLTERFHSPGGGSGIGLSLVREIAAAHGGTLTARTRPGGGSLFLLALGPSHARHARTGPGAGSS
ncbi:HAMP domain-containing histidine kinase [Streptomyces luteolifulvus]|uniref:histidine kinase n=1 Tax=Streptomyces luteolifulvus TaxID=2615112 RepID=A0A6H9USM5_9ACTN|nr:HAMP domain-containing sensor histidine kinase [Streptomyces luteolifulvus]KAB1141735.1 HAMP domain-containing histidine kinase [Streptomyces luteolifulvus]